MLRSTFALLLIPPGALAFQLVPYQYLLLFDFAKLEDRKILPSSLSPLLPSLSSLDRFSRLELGCDRGGGSVRSGELPKLLEVKARAFLVFVVGKGDITYLFISSD
jgi:hypothetical protein